MAGAKKEIPTRSIRISDETKDALNIIVAEVGGSADKVMQALISSWNTRSLAVKYPTSAAYIDDIETHVEALATIMRTLVTAKETAEQTAREQVQSQLKVKEQAISDYQKKIAALQDVQSRAETAEERAQEAERMAHDLREQVDGLRILSAAAAETDSLKAELSAARDDLVALRAQLEAKDEIINVLREALTRGGEHD